MDDEDSPLPPCIAIQEEDEEQQMQIRVAVQGNHNGVIVVGYFISNLHVFDRGQ